MSITYIDCEPRLVLERGRQYRGWTLTHLLELNLDAAFGTHLFVFSRSGDVVQITNVHWGSDRMYCCFNGQKTICPVELKMFASRHTKILSDPPRPKSPPSPFAWKPEG
ncbi:MAG: hypothetical protein WC050_01980 [Candidatus Paceibacterota bacterium]